MTAGQNYSKLALKRPPVLVVGVIQIAGPQSCPKLWTDLVIWTERVRRCHGSFYRHLDRPLMP